MGIYPEVGCYPDEDGSDFYAERTVLQAAPGSPGGWSEASVEKGMVNLEGCLWSGHFFPAGGRSQGGNSQGLRSDWRARWMRDGQREHMRLRWLKCQTKSSDYTFLASVHLKQVESFWNPVAS